MKRIDLVLAVKGEYFHQIKSGEKTEEYRLDNNYWRRRLANRDMPYRKVIITCGYPKRDDTERRLVFPYVGWERKTITHPHFGPEPVTVFAIQLTNNPIF